MERQRLYRTRKDRIFGGVAGGLGVYLRIHPALVRLGLVILVTGSLVTPQLLGILMLAYIAVWVAVPEIAEAEEPHFQPVVPEGMVRPRQGRMLAGVCAGLAQYTNLNPTLVRIAFVLLGLTGVGVVAYAAGWVLIPKAKR
jgi:phage shock protein C